jgi:hypothetical protein
MLNVEFEGSYDKETNISILRFINTPEDVDYIVSKASSIWRGDGKHKSWNITDISKMGMAPPKLVIYYNKLVKPIIKEYLVDYVVIAGTILEKVATRLFNTFLGERHPIVSSVEEAQEIIKKWQEERGVLPSLHGE